MADYSFRVSEVMSNGCVVPLCFKKLCCECWRTMLSERYSFLNAAILAASSVPAMQVLCGIELYHCEHCCASIPYRRKWQLGQLEPSKVSKRGHPENTPDFFADAARCHLAALLQKLGERARLRRPFFGTLSFRNATRLIGHLIPKGQSDVVPPANMNRKVTVVIPIL